MKKTLIFILILTINKLAFSNKIFNPIDLTFPEDSIEVNLLEINNDDFIQILNQIDSMIAGCFFTKKGIPNYKFIQIVDHKTIYIHVEQGYCFHLNLYQIPGIDNSGLYLHNNSYHIVNFTTDSLFNKIYKVKSKITLPTKFQIKELPQIISVDNKPDQLFFEINLKNNKFEIKNYIMCKESEDQIALLSIDDIDYKIKKYDNFGLVFKSSNFNDTCFGYAFIHIEFNNINQMKIVKINSIDFINLYKCNFIPIDLEYTSLAFSHNPLRTSSIDKKILDEIMKQIRLNINELQFYVPKRYRWYNRFFPSKINKFKKISKNEYVSIRFILIPEKKIP